MKKDTKSFKICLFEYARINDIAYINVFGFRVFKKMGGVYSLFGVVFNGK